MKFVVGKHYSRRTIHEALGGDLESYVPHRDGRIVAGCFKRGRNPEVPNEIQVGTGTNNKKYARVLAEQGGSIPVFVKSEDLVSTSDLWQYHGEYKFIELLDDKQTLSKAEEKSGRHGELTCVLRLDPVPE